MKIRYSNGWVGSDASSAQWLYYSAWKKDGNYIKEDGIANLEAKWETAHKQDLGIEMGWLQNTLTLNVDFFDETREDIFLPPIVTMFVGGVGYKEVNMGAVKKHGMEIELNYSNSTRNGFHYNAGVMFGLNENRITRFNDAPYIPAYQKQSIHNMALLAPVIHLLTTNISIVLTNCMVIRSIPKSGRISPGYLQVPGL